MNEADKRANLIDPKLIESGWGVGIDNQLIHEINNTIHLTFIDGGSNYSFLFSIN
jgi:hypothetical protein